MKNLILTLILLAVLFQTNCKEKCDGFRYDISSCYQACRAANALERIEALLQERDPNA